MINLSLLLNKYSSRTQTYIANISRLIFEYYKWPQFIIILESSLKMAEKTKELEQDIAELKQLTLQAERPKIQAHLAQLLSQLKTQLQLLQSIKIAEPVPLKQEVPIVKEGVSTQINYTSLTKYAWDQQGNKVKIIFSLDGVGKECTKDQVDVIFDKWSLELRVRGYKNQNLIFSNKRLFGEILPGQSKFALKNNSITITLVKKQNKSWSQISYKEDKISAKQQKEEKVDDPQAGIMNMMKKMYEEGDQNMKRTIAEAWTKANDKKGQQPDFSDRYDFLNKKK